MYKLIVISFQSIRFRGEGIFEWNFCKAKLWP